MPFYGCSLRPLLCSALAVILAGGIGFAADDLPAGLPVLVYHQIRTGPNDPPEGMTVVARDRFAEEMRRLHDEGYRALDMAEVVRFLQGEKFPAKSVAIQFDDGWSSALRALPILKQYGFKATFWVIAGSVGSGSLYMDWKTVRRLDRQQPFKVYSHTMTHPYEQGNSLVDWTEGRAPGKSAADAQRELTESKRVLEAKLGHPVPYLDWPAGIYSPALIDMAKKSGYTAAVTTDDGMNHPGGDPLMIHRTIVNGACDERAFERILLDGRYQRCDAP